MRVLHVEDDSVTAASIAMMLRAEDFIVDITDLGEDVLEISKLHEYDIIILDLMLPGIDGYEVLRRLRAGGVQTPTLILSALASPGPEAGIKGLAIGADDFLAKPFDRRELIARIQTVVRRAKVDSEAAIRIGKLLLHLDRKTVEVDGQRLPLTRKEYEILELLSMRKGAALTKEAFLEHLYGGMDEPEPKVIDVFMCKLRKKLRHATGGENYIENVWGRGYVLRDPASSVTAHEPTLTVD